MKIYRIIGFLLLVALLMLHGTAGQAQNSILTFNDKAAFLAATGSTSATGPLPDIGLVPPLTTIGSVTFEAPRYFIGTANLSDIQLPPGGRHDWSPLLPGNELGISNGLVNAFSENIDVTVANTVFALGFDFVEPETEPGIMGPFIDSTFEVTMKSGNSVVGTFAFNAPNDTAWFVGVWSNVGFNKLEIRETVGSDENEFYGEFYSGTTPLSASAASPEPATLSLLIFCTMAGTSRFRHRRT